VFCQETVAELHSLADTLTRFPEILFVFPASRDEGEEFFNSIWPEARAVSDPGAKLFSMFEVSRASLRQLFGPGVWLNAIQAARAGYKLGRRPIGNPWLLPGMFLITPERIRWRWKFRNVGDHPDFDRLVELLPVD
jgi:hypothetical protein